ncbi:flagellar basal-body rod protein FlgF [Ferrimonas balearica DSM 9799]|uniref:Flagellar basal-body rod protein FlgF n=1 Tax=Ferrimonas balearica (strain DSM 9799 / CCM 4581 / KCTC 23876 / PAT) TaxID=550540 RepID=E1SQT8_FERBD|nr:flagellar basal-body rod protein FlgF [Ferrimonas balearica]ADN76863.1 flagellar basal-body rod protein FlgF [Ferrimonas balearica DSM 9799]MBW3140153.1 flagellar basal-body rod protein FlgF [Ferrimonas balearica]MBW3165173.1 flagellar basal-body rod protein FlgF [Ferrimonas balearica]MBY5979962.1 flagellar basal-body rod protein FlgF [Ferrimonas balearica]MBY6106739.1 flagellar basal-body rod protein FlgF [Ferrimonas balearica]
MDNYLYIAASGAKQNLHQLASHANNLANAKSDGFKADMSQARAMQAFGEGLPTRVFAMTERPATNFDPGAIKTTGRTLDVAIKDQGWFVVQDDGGNEALTRAGSLRFDEAGMLMNSEGQPIMGLAGPIFLPLPIEKVEIAQDGMITVRPQGAPANAMEEVGQLRLVNPPLNSLTKGEDGLFRRLDGQPYANAVEVTLVTGAVEGSNVNPVNELVGMIEAQRQFDMQLKLMKTAEENDRAHAQLMR